MPELVNDIPHRPFASPTGDKMCWSVAGVTSRDATVDRSGAGIGRFSAF